MVGLLPLFSIVMTMSSSSKDPSFVWKSQTVANAFTDIRESVPLHRQQLGLMVRVIRTFQAAPKRFLDLGCGDGPLSRKLFREFPSAEGIMVDFSEPMLENARQKLAASSLQHRATLIPADFSTSDWKTKITQERYDVVVSGFAIHHLTDKRKQELYREIYNDLLSPGGVFLNLEHVASPDPVVEHIFDGAFVDSMYDFHQGQKSREECEDAVQYDLSVDDDANLVASVETQCEWLREIGYQHVDCYFKFLILALFGGVKKA